MAYLLQYAPVPTPQLNLDSLDVWGKADSAAVNAVEPATPSPNLLMLFVFVVIFAPEELFELWRVSISELLVEILEVLVERLEVLVEIFGGISWDIGGISSNACILITYNDTIRTTC